MKRSSRVSDIHFVQSIPTNELRASTNPARSNIAEETLEEVTLKNLDSRFFKKEDFTRKASTLVVFGLDWQFF